MNQKHPSNPPVSDRWAYLWLALGAILLILSTGQFRLAFAAWVAPVFLIHFFRSQRVGKGYWIILPVLYVSYAISWRAVLEFIGPLPVFLIFNIMITLAGSLPSLAFLVRTTSTPSWAARRLLVSTNTTKFYLYNLV